MDLGLFCQASKQLTTPWVVVCGGVLCVMSSYCLVEVVGDVVR